MVSLLNQIIWIKHWSFQFVQCVNLWDLKFNYGWKADPELQIVLNMFSGNVYYKVITAASLTEKCETIQYFILALILNK